MTCLILFILIAIPGGCTSVEPAPPPTASQRAAYNYNWAFINRSRVQVTMVRLYLDSPRGKIPVTNPVSVPPPGDDWGAYTTSSATPPVLPNRVFLDWWTNDGLLHEQSVSLTGLVDPAAGTFRGTVWFSFYNAAWQAAALTRQQMTDRIRQGRTWAPDAD